MDAQLEITIAPDILYMCAKIELYSSSQYKDIHV